MNDDFNLKPEELDKLTKIAAKNFFQWNSGKNTPNILLQLSGNVASLGKALEESAATTNAKIEALSKVIHESSESSSKLATALNRITLFYAVVTFFGVAAMIVQAWAAWKASNP